ncbi:hypothetical protein SERLA73DRAFT_174314 [Serpula lacrymans var. lacrymans S7.3]|uniref:Uncharacterized protein n=2 Tax=Serpula lacrymans var. lacrymans TaxID=341189 RepID=F8PF60_SERL3|nr:uncharacterized protein SERLADRAFT_455781 [Serpula lacrymans var. lacrymans S7.9]EGO05252.1 hypothetical protein SERLA73DRAFT_174314 [Serpula lacrymans var. lacrymans S7.3]EGO31106.1 hypothetical protein SERLADRAFT_455781 [Serpula lacrymans var. lacrymans S7.9]
MLEMTAGNTMVPGEHWHAMLAVSSEIIFAALGGIRRARHSPYNYSSRCTKQTSHVCCKRESGGATERLEGARANSIGTVLCAIFVHEKSKRRTRICKMASCQGLPGWYQCSGACTLGLVSGLRTAMLNRTSA